MLTRFLLLVALLWASATTTRAEDVTELETLRLKERLMVNPHDPDALKFFAVLDEWKARRKKA